MALRREHLDLAAELHPELPVALFRHHAGTAKSCFGATADRLRERRRDRESAAVEPYY
jgi:hypothetical protein